MFMFDTALSKAQLNWDGIIGDGMIVHKQVCYSRLLGFLSCASLQDMAVIMG